MEAKSAAQLTREDLLRSPVWEWVGDESDPGMDESYVRPKHIDAVPRGGFSQYLVSGVVSLRDKSELPAGIAVTVQGQRVICNPEFVFLFDRHLAIISNETERLLSRYTTRAGNRVIKWRLNVLIQGETKPRRGTVRRSLYYLLANLLWEFAKRRLAKAAKRAP